MTCTKCKYNFCKECLRDVINNAGKSRSNIPYPLCKESISNIDRTTILEFKSITKHINQDHTFGSNESNSSSHSISSTKQAIKILVLPVGLVVYRLYKFSSRKKPSTSSSSKEYPSVSQWFFKQVLYVKENSSDIIATSLATTALFVLLTQKNVNLALPMNKHAVNVLGYKYLNFVKTIEGNTFFRTIKAQFANGILLNAGLSLSVTLIARFCYKLLDGSNVKRNKKTIHTLKEIT